MSALALAAAAGLTFLFARSSKRRTTPPPGSVSNLVTGKSGTPWKVVFAERMALPGRAASEDLIFSDIFLPRGAKGPHEEFRVLRYRQAGENKSSRILISQDAAAAAIPGIVELAMADFGIVRA